MNEHVIRVAVAGLFIALGAADDELDPAIEILERHPVPPTIAETAQAARDALALVRMEAGRAP